MGVCVYDGGGGGGGVPVYMLLWICMWMHLGYVKDKQSLAVAWHGAGK